MRSERREGRVEGGRGGGGSSVGGETRRRSVFRADSPGSDSPSSCWKAAAIPPVRQNCLGCCSVKTRPRNKRFRVSKCRKMSDCVAFYMSAGSEGGGQWICGLSSDLLFPTFHSVTCVDSTRAPVLPQRPDWPSFIKQADKLLQV